MNDLITTYAELLTDGQSDNLLFRYYPNLPQGSLVQVGIKEGDLERYKVDDCYEFIVEFFGEKRKLSLEDIHPKGYDSEFDVNLFEFKLKVIEDVEQAEETF